MQLVMGQIDQLSRHSELKEKMKLYNKDEIITIKSILGGNFIANSNMTWFFSTIKSTNTNGALLADNIQSFCSLPRFPIQPVVTVFFSESPRIAVPRIGSVVCFLSPLGHH